MWTEASLLVPDFVISVYSSSCNFLLFGLLFAPLHSHSVYWHPQRRMTCQGIYTVDRERREERMRPREWHELPNIELVKTAIIRLAFGFWQILVILWLGEEDYNYIFSLLFLEHGEGAQLGEILLAKLLNLQRETERQLATVFVENTVFLL